MADFKLSKSSKLNIKDVKEELKTLVDRVLKKSPHDFGIPTNGGKRTAQQQNNLYHQKPRVTQLDGFKNKSYHQTGNAFDIFILDEHGACWDCRDKYKEVAALFKKEFVLMKEEGLFKENEKFEWGGDWIRFKDLPHFQITIVK